MESKCHLPSEELNQTAGHDVEVDDAQLEVGGDTSSEEDPLRDPLSGEHTIALPQELPLIQKVSSSLEAPNTVLASPTLGTQSRRSVRLKIKGLTGGFSTKPLITLGSGSPLFHQFPFNGLTIAEIIDLFHSYRILLGDTDLQRDTIISHIRSIQRATFEIYMHQVVEKSRTSSFELVIIIHNVDAERTIVIQ